MEVLPVILQGSVIRLEPLRYGHAPSMAKHVDENLYRYFAALSPKEPTEAACHEYIRRRLEAPAVSFAMVHIDSEEAIGHTSYMDIQPEHRTLEIGSTWISVQFHGTRVNPEAKLLMLQHAFENLGCLRVQLKTDERNLQSQRAIEKLGAKKEGVLRKHSIMPDGHVRNTVMYSILDDEWPDVKQGLMQRLSSFESVPS